MKNYMMIFRYEPNENYQPTEAETQAMHKHWSDWIGSLAAQLKFVDTNQLGFEGALLNAQGNVAEGPVISDAQLVGGNMIVKASDIEEAIEMAKGSPILHMGGSVEIRDIIPMEA